MTPSGIEPATFRFVAQYLNHCATVVPMSTMETCEKRKHLLTLALVKPRWTNEALLKTPELFI
jgi:hypothetical protein